MNEEITLAEQATVLEAALKDTGEKRKALAAAKLAVVEAQALYDESLKGSRQLQGVFTQRTQRLVQD